MLFSFKSNGVQFADGIEEIFDSLTKIRSSIKSQNSDETLHTQLFAKWTLIKTI